MARKGRRNRKASHGGAAAGWLGRVRAVCAGFLFGRPVDQAAGARLQEIKGLFFVALSLWLIVSMVSYHTPPQDAGAAGHNWGGQAGFFLANGAFLIAGWAGYLIGVLGFAWGVVILARRSVAWPALRLLGALCLVASVAFMLQLAFGPELVDGKAVYGEGAFESGLPYGPGGWLALTSSGEFLVPKFGLPGLWILLTLLALASFMLATEMAFYPAIHALGQWLRERREQGGEGRARAIARWFGRLLRGLWDFLRGADLEPRAAGAASAVRGVPARALESGRGEEFDEEDEYEHEYEMNRRSGSSPADAADGRTAAADRREDEDEDEEGEEDDEQEEEDETVERELRPAAGPRRVGAATPLFESVTPPPGPWTFPSLDILEQPGGDDAVSEDLEISAAKLENALRSFRVESEVVAAQVGPAVTLFELTVTQGTRMNKVTQLSQEIAAALQARSVRIIAPIPGRSTIGIEVPNKKRRMVRLRELIHQKAYDKAFMPLPLFLGMDAEGTPIVEDLARMPHLLIAGTTGSGKSVCINTILASLLLTRSPHDVQMILVDPKMVELQMFANVPHLLLPVVTDARQATNVLNWVVEKMEGRYELFKDAGVKNIKGYNSLGEERLREVMGENWSDERTPRHLSYIVVVIDEMADLMMVAKKDAEYAITRLAQKSRAVGVHVILATQRPSTDVITGVIKGNLPTRIAFQVASKVDSRVILDTMGAEKLLGGGDMLYTPPQSSQVRRVQGALVEDHELQKIVDFVCRESAPRFNQELVQTATGTSSAGSLAGQRGPDDPMFDEAVRVVLKTKRGSASLLQRALSIGYTRASRLIDLMTEEGVLGEHRGSKSREILLTLADWEEIQGALAGRAVGEEHDDQ